MRGRCQTWTVFSEGGGGSTALTRVRCPTQRNGSLKAADPRHGSLDPEMVALDPLLQVLVDVMKRILIITLNAM
jgi:hypothetical protein